MDIGIKKAFILAGGLGTRLRPVTYELSKLIMPVQGKPILQWAIEGVKRFGVEEIVLAVGYKHEQIEGFFKDGKQFGVKLHYNVEDEYMGTAGALKIAEKHFKNEKKFIGMNGDEMKDIDFAAMGKVHDENKAVATIALATIDYTKAGGLVRIDGNRVVEFSEKPADEKGGKKLIHAGAYTLSPKIFDYIPAGKKVSIEQETFPQLAKEGKLFCADMTGRQFLQTDNFERYEKAIFEWKGFK
ncbi:MAG: nucleotidyltransferase family protein [Candidatus Diapherotrites archaeon]|uniref:Nucleotidyltransferase family protein n=1 Tax=Candidatus Iainarchaeum sp. TaxID=3101447 RepID=A0A938YTT7_9ARCH|nr:nucleotidyltransferase family protein [Candidatus Diapherotrites archaeon]